MMFPLTKFACRPVASFTSYKYHTSHATFSKLKNHYETLGVPTSASQEHIKEAFLKLSKQYHPDTDPANKNLHKRFIEIHEAYEILSKIHTKLKYDGELRNSNKSTNVQRPVRNYAEYYREDDLDEQHEPITPHTNIWKFSVVLFTIAVMGAGYHFTRFLLLRHTRNSEIRNYFAEQRKAEEDDETFLRNLRNRK